MIVNLGARIGTASVNLGWRSEVQHDVHARGQPSDRPLLESLLWQ